MQVQYLSYEQDFSLSFRNDIFSICHAGLSNPIAFEGAMTDLCRDVQRDRLHYSACSPLPGLDLMVTLFRQWLIFKLIIISYLCIHNGVHGREREHFL
jgi:hypothetical protein